MMISMNKEQQGAQEECNNVARGREEPNRQSGTPERETGQQDPKIPWTLPPDCYPITKTPRRLQMYVSTPAYALRQYGPTTRLINKPEWNGSGDQYVARREGDKSLGKGERDRRRQGTRQERLPHDKT